LGADIWPGGEITHTPFDSPSFISDEVREGEVIAFDVLLRDYISFHSFD
jgi:hypothetical protein